MTAPTASTTPFAATPTTDATAVTRATLDAYLRALDARADFARHLADDATITIFGGPGASGRDAVAGLIAAIHFEMFDSSLRVQRTICDGDHAAAELVFVGTHTGEFAGVPATGRAVEVPYTAAYDVTADGRIAAIRAYMPMQILMAQIGAA